MSGSKTIRTGTDFNGVGSFHYAMNRVFPNHENVFSCDWDYFARISFVKQFGTEKDLELAKLKFKNDKYFNIDAAPHKFSFYFPYDVYDREIPEEPLDVYCATPPCQSFSLAGKRGGKDDSRGILFFNSHEFIHKNKPRTFIFENVKGLISDDDGNTFKEWINLLGGKSVNGLPILFPYDDSVPYHIYWKVMNVKDFGVPQNRERVFIVGIRDDCDNTFTWPKPIYSGKRLKDVLETEVDDKYFLSDKSLNYLVRADKERGRLRINLTDGNGISSVITSNYRKGVHNQGETYIQTDQIKVSLHLSGGKLDKTKDQNKRVYDPDGISPTVHAFSGGQQHLKVIQMNDSKESGGQQPYQQNRIYDTKGISPSLCKGKSDLCIPVLTPDRLNKSQNGRRFKNDGDPSFTLTAQDRHGIYDGFKIRRLTPRECFRLQDFPDSFEFEVSDSQLYKQAGNSVPVKFFELILEKFTFLC